MNSVITAAIEQRRILKLAYSTGSRVVEPHVYGLASNSSELLRCYQLAGESASRHRADWKLLLAADLSGVEVLDIRFDPRGGYDPDDPTIRVANARIQPAQSAAE